MKRFATLVVSFVIISAVSGCVDFGQRLEQAVVAGAESDRVRSERPDTCPFFPINWRGERTALTLMMDQSMEYQFSLPMRNHIWVRFQYALAQRGAEVVPPSVARYELRVTPSVRGRHFSFLIVVVDAVKRPIAHKYSRHELMTAWENLSERVRAELVDAMALNAFVDICIGAPPQRRDRYSQSTSQPYGANIELGVGGSFYHQGGILKIEEQNFGLSGHINIVPNISYTGDSPPSYKNNNRGDHHGRRK